MKVYHLFQKQFLPLTQQEAWAFFSSPENLAKITPPTMHFEILHITGNGKSTYQGQMISYRIRLFPLVTVRWLTEITHVKEPEYFVDDQRFGPYSLWHHQHRFIPVAGGVEMTDEITYAIPFGFIGRLANRIFVSRQLETIFKFRYNTLDKLFNSKSVTKTQLA